MLVEQGGFFQEMFASHSEHFQDMELAGCFTDPERALVYARNHRIDFALLDTNLRESDVMELCKELKVLYPDIILVSVATDRMKQIFFGKSKVRAVMFGRFQLFVGDELVYFSNAKAKELLALCLDHRGGEVTMEEAIDKLWPDRLYDDKVKKLYRKAVMALQATLKEAGAEEIFRTRRGSCYANVANMECDYFQFLETRDSEVSLYDGNYLFDYGWGEETLAMLERLAE
jgi:CheY-like chemotaxis protein